MKQIFAICALISLACSAQSAKKVKHAPKAEAKEARPVVIPAQPKPAQNEILNIARENNAILNHIVDRLEAIEQGIAHLLNSLVRDTHAEKAVAMAKAETAKRMHAKPVGPTAQAKHAKHSAEAKHSAKAQA